MTTLTTLTIRNGIHRAFYSDGGSLIISPNDAKNLSRVYDVRIETDHDDAPISERVEPHITF